MIETVIATAIGACVGGLASGIVSWVLARGTAQALAALETEVRQDISRRIGELEVAAKGCLGGQNRREIESLRTQQHENDNLARKLETQMIGVQTELKNVSAIVRDMSLKLDRYAESTARQDEKIAANASRIGGVHAALRKHTDKED